MVNVELNSVERLIGELEIEQPKRFSPEQLQTFTSAFSMSLGFGGFGTVYKGLLDNGVEVAVKVLGHETRSSSMAEVSDDQFKAEVSTLCKTHHRNLVKLHGFCFALDMKALVYEFVPNGSLEKVLYGSKTIKWATLCSIAIGTANGLSYLHKDCEPRIIHYDIKPANILLDSNFVPKIGDFGLAKLITRDKTHVTMCGFRGTRGYGAPELWGGASLATYKCDVYSYGILLFEILGRRIRENSFPNQVWEKLKKGQLEDFMKFCGIEEKNIENTKRISMIALWCIQFLPRDRPSMSEVVRLLEGREEILMPPDPFRGWNSSSVSSSSMTTVNPELEEKEKEKGRIGNARISVFIGPWGPWGSPHGNHWDDGVFSTIKQIQLFRGEREIRAIQIVYCGKNGESIVSKKHGWAESDIIDKIELNYPDEFLTKITGYHAFEKYAYEHIYENKVGGLQNKVGGLHLLRSLCFFTNKKKYGPFGNERGTYFSSGKDGKVVGFHGKAGAYLDAIGLHIEY